MIFESQKYGKEDMQNRLKTEENVKVERLSIRIL